MLNLNQPLPKAAVATEPVWKVSDGGVIVDSMPYTSKLSSLWTLSWIRTRIIAHFSTGTYLWQERFWHHLSLTDSQGAQKPWCYSSPVSTKICSSTTLYQLVLLLSFSLSLIDSSREQIQDAVAVYFVRPTRENIDKICQDCKAQLYSSFYFNFISPISRSLLEDLARAAVEANCVEQIAKVGDLLYHCSQVSPSHFGKQRGYM